MRVGPFRGLRYDPAVAGPAGETSAPAYDDPDRFAHAAHRTSNPYTVMGLLSGTAGAGAGSPAVARATLARWIRTGVLVQDPVPSLYLYEQHELRHGQPTVQRGIVGALDLRDVDDGSLLLHEDVDPGRVHARAASLSDVPIDITPIMAVHLGGSTGDLHALLDGSRTHPPVAAFTDDASIDHRLWQISDPDRIAALRAAYAPVRAVLADGHHRVAAAHLLRHRRDGTSDHDGGWSATTAFLIDASHGGPELLPIHRLVRRPPQFDDAGDPVVPGFHPMRWTGGVDGLVRVLDDAPGLSLGMATAQGTWLLRADDSAATRALAAVDVGPALARLAGIALTAVVLRHLGEGPVEAVVDATAAAEQLVADDAATLLLLPPPSVDQVLAVADAGLRMPAKTTWFRPKPRAGLVMRPLDDPPDHPLLR